VGDRAALFALHRPSFTLNRNPNPAIVTQDAARSLPRWTLLLLCLAYVVPGYVGREPWKNADIAAFGVMQELLDASGWQSWLQPTLMGLPADPNAPLAYWLGAAAMWLAPQAVAPDFAARIPFGLMLAGTLIATWYAVYHLARRPSAQPVAFAFGGEATPRDYARALADGGLLALIATLGLAQLSHETTPALAQLFFASLVFYALAALPRHVRAASVALIAGLPGLALSGAPVTALLYGALSLVALLWPSRATTLKGGARWLATAALLVGLLLAAGSTVALDLLGSNGPTWRTGAGNWRALARLFLWFTWPVWPFVLWTLWRWRHHLRGLREHPHLGLPLVMAGVPVLHAVLTTAGDRVLLLALPSLAALAAFALPTFQRSMSALIDWFTVLFFTAWAITIWVVWIAMETGVPAKPAANVARLAPGFEPVFQWPAFVAALLGSLAWIALARWRTGRHRTALWKSMVLPAAGATLCWGLLMTLWLPALDYGRAYAPQMREVQRTIGAPTCVEVHGLSPAQVAAVRFHGGWNPVPARSLGSCPWLLVDVDAMASLQATVQMNHWRAVTQVRRPTDGQDTLLLLKRISPP